MEESEAAPAASSEAAPGESSEAAAAGVVSEAAAGVSSEAPAGDSPEAPAGVSSEDNPEDDLEKQAKQKVIQNLIAFGAIVIFLRISADFGLFSSFSDNVLDSSKGLKSSRCPI
ncbi:hypothetical protein WA026_016028 [Henosepilachna vigintioctopunctata]|uniref:Uncharacterized protein n=1 Tax=Henosepilachna vigintioctopunctata TaxID=420089 RepID=A0AAW1U3E0_9CUCU